MRKSLIATVFMIALTLVAGAAYAEDAGEAPSKSAGVVNINTADASQFALLPRVGPAAAQRIVKYREANGPFKKTTDLMQVQGIGDKTFELLSSYLVLDGKTTLSSKVAGPKRPRKSAASRPNSSTPAN